MSTVVLQNDAMVFGSQSPYNRYITEPGAKEKFFAFFLPVLSRPTNFKSSSIEDIIGNIIDKFP